MKHKITRRDFLQKSSEGVLAAVGIPYLLKSNMAKALTIPEAKDMNLKNCYEHFGADEKTIREVMSEALSDGGDYSDVYFQHRIVNNINLEDKSVNAAYNKVDLGVGIRVLKGDQTGYSFTEEITPQAMKLAAKTAANIASSGKKTGPAELKLHKTPNYYPIKTPWEKVGIERKIPYLEKINDKIFAQDKRVIKATLGFNNETSLIMIATSEGRIVFDYQPTTQIFASCTAEQNGRREQNFSMLAGRQGIEFFTPENIDYLANEAVQQTVALFEAVKPSPGEMEIVLAPGVSGILLHEAIGHGMEADFNRKKISIFCDKINKSVAEKFVTIVDDGTNPNLRGSINVDDESNDTEKTYLVKDGVLCGYLHDRISAQYYNAKPTGNGRRESFRFEPQPRMRNTYMLPGPHKKEEIIRSVKKGLYAEWFTNGQVNIGAGDFTFYVKSGRLIEDGKLTMPVKDVNIIGNGPEVLKNIVMVGDDFEMDTWGGMCGKNGQYVPVGMGLPTVKVSKITVGGVS